MTTIAQELQSLLPAPRHNGPDDDSPQIAQHRGVRVVDAQTANSLQIIKQTSNVPPYGSRGKWRPREGDFGDGGAYPECLVAQYPLDMGKKSSTSTALAVQVDGDGAVKWDAIAKRGHSEGRIVQASFKDLIPLRQRADAGDIDLARPDAEAVAAVKEKTQAALSLIVASTSAAARPKNVNVGPRKEATYVRYTPTSQFGDNTKKNDRIFKIQEKQRDPMEPPKFKHKKIPRGPPSPPAPVMHSPPRKLTAEDQEAWKIPPPISNWKNPKGYTIALDKRLAADGRGLQDVSINDKFATLSESLYAADRLAREEVKQRALMQQRLAEKEKLQKEETLRDLAQRAREERAQAGNAKRRMSRSSRSRSGSYSSTSSRSRSRSNSIDSEEEEARAREKARAESRREDERKLRQSRMGAEMKIKVMAREQNRDISEKVALGLAKPTQSSESMWDSRLFNQTSGFDTGFNEDQAYDKPLFAAQNAIQSIYRPRNGQDDGDDEEAASAEMARISKAQRFGQGVFKGIGESSEAREGPVQFEKDNDPFDISGMIAETEKAQQAGKRYGIEEGGRDSKRARIEEDE